LVWTVTETYDEDGFKTSYKYEPVNDSVYILTFIKTAISGWVSIFMKYWFGPI
jgi:hypothetical protein